MCHRLNGFAFASKSWETRSPVAFGIRKEFLTTTIINRNNIYIMYTYAFTQIDSKNVRVDVHIQHLILSISQFIFWKSQF